MNSITKALDRSRDLANKFLCSLATDRTIDIDQLQLKCNQYLKLNERLLKRLQFRPRIDTCSFINTLQDKILNLLEEAEDVGVYSIKYSQLDYYIQSKPEISDLEDKGEINVDRTDSDWILKLK